MDRRVSNMRRVFCFILGLLHLAVAVDQKVLKYPERPNIVFILTDDQDLHMDSLEFMPLLKEYVTEQGTFFKRHYCTTAVCCPSRVSLWTGKNAHNTNVTDVFPPYGGYPKFISQGLNKNYLPVWLKEAGYNTFYTGKLFNSHTVDNYDNPYPNGWTSSDFLLDPYTYQYLNATTQRNREEPVSWEGHYSTDVLAEKAYGLLSEALTLGGPFFLTVATNAPHSNVATFIPSSNFHEIVHEYGANENTPHMTAPIPADRHKDLFPDAKVPRLGNFNPKSPSGASWIKHLPELNDTVIEYNDYFYRRRLQALQAVDEIVEGLVNRLENYGILDNTFIIFSTDNGFHISQHRLHPGKECGFEEDINIPLIIRGPGIPINHTTDIVTAHTDLAPTFLKMAGLPPRPDFDGIAIPLVREEIAQASLQRHEHVNVEFWGSAIPEGIYGFSLDDGKIMGFLGNNTYKALRVIGDDYNLYYSVWCTNEHELYDMINDPYQTHNIYPSTPISSTSDENVLSASLTKLILRLDALVLVTKSCKGDDCINPWNVLHPNGQIRNLRDALDTRFDGFYAYIGSRVRFDRCELGYIIEAEGPQSVPRYGIEYIG